MASMIDSCFGKVLKKIRQEKGLSQEQLAFSAHLHRTYISQLERGIKSPSLVTIHKLCASLEVSVTYLVTLLEEELNANSNR